MESPIRKVQKGLINKTWERCKSFGGIGRSKRSSIFYQRGKSKSLPHDLSTTLNHDQEEKQMIKKLRVAPQGCFFIYVGAQKQRFVIKTEYINHPLFKILLEEAESEYGYKTEGPLKLPCEVGIFIKVLVELDGEDHEPCKLGCNFTSRVTPPRFFWTDLWLLRAKVERERERDPPRYVTMKTLNYRKANHHVPCMRWGNNLK